MEAIPSAKEPSKAVVNPERASTAMLSECSADNDGKNASDERQRQDGDEAGTSNIAGTDQTTTASTEDETKESTNEVIEQKGNEIEKFTENTTENADKNDTEVAKNHDSDKISPSTAGKRQLDADSETQDEATAKASKSDEANDGKSSIAAAEHSTASLPKRPVKRARTAYFIFTDEKRPKVQAAHPGEGVAVVAKALGQMWGNLSADEKKVYQDQAAKERERVSQELEAYKSAGGKDLDSPSVKARDPLATILPVARIRKICKLDPEVRGLSKEALLLVTKCTELMLEKLGKETVKVAQLQNRRKLLPDDVAHVCAHREQFLFLKDDVKDMVKSMESADGKASGGKKGDAAKQIAAAGTKKLTSYFSAPK
ncbi:unnamed protein product [Cylindrotheca closterium]|uniref:HMG box domain-containing protein n=1 Tax=Cylindrotheca closterium TaxID=2856 RepID=A0AAD2CJ67_9STRA|nr:unnamed protein product [Cylindrotheca closterium]